MNNKILLNPGPVTVSETVQQSALKNTCHREKSFCDIIKNIRHGLVKLVEGQFTIMANQYNMQGKQTYPPEVTIDETIKQLLKLVESELLPKERKGTMDDSLHCVDCKNRIIHCQCSGFNDCLHEIKEKMR